MAIPLHVPLHVVSAEPPPLAPGPWAWSRLLTAPHRLAFFAGGVGLAVVALWWLACLALPVPWAVARPVAHGLAMALAFMPPFMVGFMFTAGPRWLGVEGPDARALLAPMLIWATGWTLALVGFHVAAWLAALGLALAALAWARWLGRFVGLVMQSPAPDQLHARAVAAACVLGLLALLLAAVGVGLGSPTWARMAVQLALWGFVAPVFATVSHRMIPFFTAAVLPQLEAWRPNSLLALMLGALAVAGVVEMTAALAWPPAVLLGAAALLVLAGVALLALALRWGLVGSLRGQQLRLLAMLHGGFVWLGVALLLEGLSVGLQALGYAGLGLAPLHALTLGYLGCTLVAMATRVASGHSGRPLAVDGLAWAFYLLLQATAVLRLAAVWEGRLLLLAALGWAIVAAAWALRYGRWLGQPRADGRPG